MQLTPNFLEGGHLLEAKPIQWGDLLLFGDSEKRPRGWQQQSGPRTSDGETSSQERVRPSAGDTARGEKARGRRGREGVPTVGGERPEGGEAHEGIGRGVV
jgi:hypothetical protein